MEFVKSYFSKRWLFRHQYWDSLKDLKFFVVVKVLNVVWSVLRYLVVRNFTNFRVRINSLKMEAEDSYETLVNLCHIARNYNTALSGTCLEIFRSLNFPKYFACNLEYISRFVNRKSVHWGASLQHFRSVNFLLLFLSDASFVSGRTFPAVRYGGRLSGLWRDQQSPLYAGSLPIVLSSAL